MGSFGRPVVTCTVLRVVTRVPPPGSPAAARTQLPELAADPGLVVEDVETGWVGAVLRTEKSGGVHLVVLEDRRGKVRSFPLGPGFWVDGAPDPASKFYRVSLPPTGTNN